MRLNCNFIWRGKFVAAGEEIPAYMVGHVPRWAVKKHAISLNEALRLCEDRRLLREKVARQKAAAIEAAAKKIGLVQ
jgi:hypothetical protein